jgi:hypothetical protein
MNAVSGALDGMFLSRKVIKDASIVGIFQFEVEKWKNSAWAEAHQVSFLTATIR